MISPATPTAKTTSTSTKVVIVNGTGEMLQLFETVLDAGHYDVVFVESTAHAYSQIRRVQPNLVILCMGLDDVGGFQVLSMLKLDPGTRDIPVLTYATQFGGDQSEPDEVADDSEAQFLGAKAAARMN